MDGRTFDILARKLGAVTSRRSALKAMLGGTVAVAVGVAVATEQADAVCGKAGVRCNRNAACCSGVCEWSTVTRGRRKVRVGACTAPACLADSATCSANDECCGGYCYYGTCHSVCISESLACDETRDCCGGLFCTQVANDSPTFCMSCIFRGDSGCTQNADCCNGDTCEAGTCIPVG